MPGSGLLVAALVALGLQSAPPDASVGGLVLNARTNAPVAGGLVALVEGQGERAAGRDPGGRDARTSPDGRFAFSHVAPGSYTLTVSTIGYIFVRRQVDVVAGAAIDLSIPIAEGTGTYQETVSVTPDRAPATGDETTDLTSAALEDLRGVVGDDPVRAVQALPGVATGNDFDAQFSVRGSAFRQVGIVVDGTATPLLFHTVQGTENSGSIAMINTDVLSGASLGVGAHPQTNGEWLGATAAFDIREGSRDRTELRASVSGTSASFVADGPIGRAKRGSWLVAVRKSYIEWLVHKIAPGVPGVIGFADTQGKLVYDLSDRQQVQFLVIGGRAGYDDSTASAANQVAHATSGSILGSLSWRRTGDAWLFNQRVSFVANRFTGTGSLAQQEAGGHETSWVWRADAARPIARSWTFDAGLKTEHDATNQTLRDFVFRQSVPTSTNQQTFDETGDQSGVYAEVGSTSAAGRMTTGVRESFDTRTRAAAMSLWWLADRQVGLFRLYASAGRVNQFPSLDAIGEAGGPVLPERAWTLDLGAGGALSPTIRWKVTPFYRRESNILRQIGEDELVGGTRVIETPFPIFASELDGTTRGVDVLIQRQADSGVIGWVGYTWAHTRDHDVVTGESFDGDFDQRHTLNVFVERRVSYRMKVSAKLRVGSNFPIVGYLSGTPDALKLSDIRNAVRLPAYARVDLDASRTFTYQRRRLTLFVEVVNALGRDNFGPATGTIHSNLTAVGYTQRLIPFLPSAGVLLEF